MKHSLDGSGVNKMFPDEVCPINYSKFRVKMTKMQFAKFKTDSGDTEDYPCG